MLTRLYVYAAIAALLLGLGAGGVWYLMAGKLADARAENTALEDALEALQEQRKADAAVLARRALASAAAAKESAALRLRLDAALTANREWADQPVPKEIQDALRQP